MSLMSMMSVSICELGGLKAAVVICTFQKQRGSLVEQQEDPVP